MDRALFAALNRGAANPLLDWLMPRITNLHQAAWFIVPVVLACVAGLWRGDRRLRVAIICAIAAVGMSDLTASRLVKAVIHRDRPCRLVAPTTGMADPDTRLLPGKPKPHGYVSSPQRDCPGSSSFPSNHASNMMALAGVGWWFTRNRARWLWFLLPLVIGYSRIYIGVHYPSDVLGGWILGGCVAALCILVAASTGAHPTGPAVQGPAV